MRLNKVQQNKVAMDQPIIGLNMLIDPLIRAQADDRGWRLFSVLHGHYSVLDIKMEGFLTATYGDKLARDLHKQGVPAVRMGMLPGPDDKVIPSVIFDTAAEGRLAADQFHLQGFENVGFVRMDPWGDKRTLLESFRDRAEELGMACHAFCMKIQAWNDDGLKRQSEKQRLFTDWLMKVPKPIGVIAVGDWIAAGYCTWAQQAGFSVPDDVAVMAPSSQSDLCECARPTITTIDRSDAERIRRACDILDGMMSGRKQPVRTRIAPSGITERESTNVLATSDRTVAAALRHMWEHLNVNMSVANVAQVVNLSPRQLERRFLAALDRGVNEELQRRRLQEFCRLLLSTAMPVADIAPMVGFGSTSYLHRVFRKVYGTTPAKYRRER